MIWFWITCVQEAGSLCVCDCVTAGVHVFQWHGLTIISWLIDDSPTLWPITSPSSPLSISECGMCRYVGWWKRGKRGLALITLHFALSNEIKAFVQNVQLHLFHLQYPHTFTPHGIRKVGFPSIGSRLTEYLNTHKNSRIWP